MEEKNRILVVDDEKPNLFYLNHLLGTEYVVFSVRDPKEAVARAKEYRPNLILLDILMPEVNGYEVFTELKGFDETKNIPVIFITGLNDSSDELKGLGMGANDYITKPFKDEVVKLRVRNQIQIVNQINMLDRRFKQQTLMATIAQCFLADEHHDVLITKTLRMIGEFMEIAQVLLFKLDEDGAVLVCTNEWQNPSYNLDTRLGSKLNLEGPIRAFIDKLSTSDEMCIHSNDPYTKEMMSSYRVNFQNYITSPVFIKGKIKAVLDFSKETTETEWKDNEINLACLAASLFSGVFEREAIEHDLITVLKLKAELTIEKERAERSSRAKSEFLSRMSHEMRTPMTAIIGMTSIAQVTADNEKKADCLRKIDSASRELLKLIDDVLNVSDIEEDKFTFSPSEFCFVDFLEKLLRGTASLFSKKNQTFDFWIDPSIPETIISDEGRLAQALMQLLRNAAKFTDDGGAVQVKAFVQSIDKGVLTMQIDIMDNGIGISEEQQVKLFTAFEQVDGSISRKFGGIGVGLYISRRVAEMLGGGISVESEIGKGTKLTFTFKAQIK